MCEQCLPPPHPSLVQVYEKHLKLKVALALDHFNKDYKKGFAFLQVH